MKLIRFAMMLSILFFGPARLAIAGFNGENVTIEYSYPDLYSGKWPYPDKIISLGTLKINPGSATNFSYPGPFPGFEFAVSESRISITNSTNATWVFGTGTMKIFESSKSPSLIVGVSDAENLHAGLSFDSHSVYIHFYDTEFAPNTTASFSVNFGNVVPPPVPEPETYAMMLSGLGLLAFLSRRHRKA